MPKTLNIAVIGAGTMAQAVHLPVLRRRWDRFAVTALVDHSPRRRRESSEVWGIEEEQRFESVADLLAAVRAKTVSVDAAVLSTDGLHVDDLLQLMRRGIPVLAEPPLGYSAQEIAKVADFERMTGRHLLMMAYPQQYDDSVSAMADQIAVKDLRMVDHEVLMPASQPLFGGAHVTTSSYDLPSEKRAERRAALQAAVVAGSGDGATQRDRDLYVKGLLTGVAHQLAVTEAVYGPVVRLSAVRHWPKGVIPGSIELLGELDGGARVRLVWHYLPFAPEYSETIQVLSARRRMQVELHAPSHGDRRSTLSLREKKAGIVQETSTTATKGSAEAMWEAFHAFVDKGTPPLSGAAGARVQVELLREVLESIVVADGRSLEAEPAEDDADSSEVADAPGSPEGAESSESADVAESPEGATAEDGASAPDYAALEVAAPDTDAPDTDAPDTGAPDVDAPDAAAAADGEPRMQVTAPTSDPDPAIVPEHDPAGGQQTPGEDPAGSQQTPGEDPAGNEQGSGEDPVVDAWSAEAPDDTSRG